MTITLNLPPATEKKLKAQAAATGKDVETIVQEAVDEKLARRQQTLAEILKPIHDEVKASGLSQDELDALADEAVAEARAARAASRKQR